MFLITIHSLIKPNSIAEKRFPDVGGAYVNCYVQFKDYDAAEKLAKLLLRERGWIPKRVTDAWVIRQSRLKTKKEKQYYSEALKYGYSLVFHMWPKNAADSDVNSKVKKKGSRQSQRDLMGPAQRA
jgi:hypothetical protein